MIVNFSKNNHCNVKNDIDKINNMPHNLCDM